MQQKMAPLNLPSSIWQFSSKLHDRIQSLLVEPNENLIVSPLSIHLALALALMGAGGQTASEIASGLVLPQIDHAAIASKYQKLISSIDPKFHLANKLFVMKGIKVQMSFNNIATKQFLSEIQEINFAKSKSAAKIINTWVESKTNSRIKKMVSSNDFNATTKLVLVNTVYFKCLWLQEFSKGSTKKRTFYQSETESSKIDMMYQRNDFSFANIKSLDAKVILLQYADSTLAMMIILPNSRTGLASLDRKLKKTSISRIINQTKMFEDLSLHLPKFKAVFECNLQEVLESFGITSMFQEDVANFGGMLQNTPIFVSKIIHKGFIEVCEKGTEAGAGTEIQFEYRTSAGAEFNANHPFRYLIYNHEHVVLFDGCFRNASTKL